MEFDFLPSGVSLKTKKTYKELLFSKNDPIAMNEFKQTLKSHCLKRYCEYLGVNDESTFIAIIRYCYEYADSFSYPRIFRFRSKIQPSKWFFSVKDKDKLPVQIKFKPQYIEFTKELYAKDTVGHYLLRALGRERTFDSICEEVGLNSLYLKNILYTRVRKEDGVEMFKTFPKENVILALKEYIHPDFWFIYPEELTEKNILPVYGLEEDGEKKRKPVERKKKVKNVKKETKTTKKRKSEK